MKYKFPEIEDVNIDTLLGIAQENFPEYKSYTKTFLFGGKAVCINKNPFCRVVVRVKHKSKENSTTLIVGEGVTFWGALLMVLLGILPGALLLSVIGRGLYEEVANVYYCELAQS